MALFTSCGERIIALVGVLDLGVVERGVPGILLEGEFKILEAWLEDAPLIYPLVQDVEKDIIEPLPGESSLRGAGSRICGN